MKRLLVSALLAVSAVGCARPDLTSSELPVKRVVIYRNGVAYFERAGEIEADRVTFKMKRRMVGDFLATLAVMQEGGSRVSSASFPIEVEKDSSEAPDLTEFDRKLDRADKRSRQDDDLREVVLRMQEGRQALRVGYVAETPVWKPSYRLVLDGSGKAQLQVWGIVQNLSGEDWQDVELALVAGAPIAFESTLGTPVTPTRPVVTDSGEVIASVPSSMTTFQEAALEAPPAAPVEVEQQASEGSSDEEAMLEDAKMAPKKAYGRAGGGAARPSPAAPPPGAVPSPPRDASALALIARQTGATRYEVGSRVTVPNESATMVMLLNQAVPGEAVYLFAPDYGVPDSSVHPFRVVRFENSGKGLLESGPIAVFEKGAFLGQGVMAQLSPKSKATVPFALERGLTVNHDATTSQEGARVSKIEGGRLFVERDQVRLTSYEVRNGGDEPAKLVVRHERQPGWRLFKPPAGTEDRTTQNQALVPVMVKSRGKAQLLVDERYSFEQELNFMDPLADEAIREFLTNPKVDQATQAALRNAWQIRSELVRVRDRQAALEGSQRELEKAARESRLSLEAIEKNNQASDLRALLTARLKEQTSALDRITKEMIEVKLKAAELDVRLRDALRTIKVQLPRGEQR